VPGMERAAERGLARSVGVSHFSASDPAAAIAAASIPPVVNQGQFSPSYCRRPLPEACRHSGVLAEVCSSPGTGQYLDQQVVPQVAQRVRRTPAQVLLRWCLPHDLLIIPKPVHRERIAENAWVFDFSLLPRDMTQLDALDRTGRTGQARET
jgi:diketogulonate reductase-like aldo/keto reductase